MQFVQNTQNISTQATGATGGIALNANTARVFFQIQNIGTNPIYVFYGGATASATNCHEILKASTAASDGTGGVAKSGTIVYDGTIAVGGTATSYVAYELAP